MVSGGPSVGGVCGWCVGGLCGCCVVVCLWVVWVLSICRWSVCVDVVHLWVV